MARISEVCHTLNVRTAPDEVRVGAQGRIVIPSVVRRELGIEPGAVLVVRREGSRLVFERRSAVRDRLRAEFRAAPATANLADELIAERRKEAWRESQEWL
jgi:AbrB family looped-hinge helix DNA binding protein